jgi:hypothetical protein
MKADLGDWIRRRLNRGIKAQGSATLDIIDRCETSVDDLQAQWADQRQAQLSIRAREQAYDMHALNTDADCF